MWSMDPIKQLKWDLTRSMYRIAKVREHLSALEFLLYRVAEYEKLRLKQSNEFEKLNRKQKRFFRAEREKALQARIQELKEKAVAETK